MERKGSKRWETIITPTRGVYNNLVMYLVILHTIVNSYARYLTRHCFALTIAMTALASALSNRSDLSVKIASMPTMWHCGVREEPSRPGLSFDAFRNLFLGFELLEESCQRQRLVNVLSTSLSMSRTLYLLFRRRERLTPSSSLLFLGNQ